MLTLDSKTPSHGSCLGESLGGFWDVGCHFIVVSYFNFDLHFVIILHFVSRLLYHVTSTPPWLLRPVKTSTSSELYPNYFWMSFLFHLLRALKWAFFTHSRFLPYAPSRHFWQKLFLSRPPWELAVLPWSWQGFILILKTQTRLISSICLIHSNIQSFIHLKFVSIHANIAKSFTCGDNFDKKILFFCFSSG